MAEYQKYLRNEHQSLKEESTDIIKGFRICYIYIRSMLLIYIFVFALAAIWYGIKQRWYWNTYISI